MKTFISFGEALVDFIPLEKNNTFEQCPGGAPANVAVGVAKQQLPAIFIGKLGRDVIGDFVIRSLKDYGVATHYVTQTDQHNTNVVFVTLDDNKQRQFNFFVEDSADKHFSIEDFEDNTFKNVGIFHFGSISLANEPIKSAVIYAISQTKQQGGLISFDPNIRMAFWDSEQRLKEEIIARLPQVDILKISDDEITYLSGQETVEEGITWFEQFNIPLMAVTLGAEGAYLIHQQQHYRFEGIQSENLIDTTGAGDAFMSGLVSGVMLLNKSIQDLAPQDIQYIGRLANHAGALATTAAGAMSALPTKQQLVQQGLREA